MSPRIDEVTGDLLLAAGEELEHTGPVHDVRAAIALEAVERAIGRLRVARAGGEATAFVAADAAALLLPRVGGELALRALALSVLPAALAQIVGLEPRPRPAGEPRRLAATELASALARPVDQDLLVAPVAHWRAEREPWALEILDTGEGLFMVRAEGGDAVLHPTSATRVFRGLVRLVRG